MLVGTAARSVQLSTGPNFTLNFSDDFTYANNTVPTGWTATNQSTNTALTHSYVVSNALEVFVDATTNPRYSTLYRSAPAANLDIVFTLGGATGTSNSSAWVRYIGVRASSYSTTSGTTYGLWANGYFFKFTDTTSTTATLVKRVSATETTLATITLPVAPSTALASNPLRFRMRANGSSIQLRVWRANSSEPTTWDATVSDTDITATGSIALGFSSTSSSGGTSVKVLYDNFECWA